MTRIAFAMEQSLGNVTHYLNLRANADVASWMQARWVPIEYHPTRTPWAVGGSLDTRRALAPVLREVDAAFIHTTTISLLAPSLLPRRPIVLSTDGPPDKRFMRQWYGLKADSIIGARMKRVLYSTVFRQAAGVVAWCDWTKESLVGEYGVAPQRVAVIPPGIDLESFQPQPRDNPLPRILFVGGDFPRKGGDLLLEVFRSRLRGKAELALVTPAEVEPEEGVTVHRALKANTRALRDVFASSDVFALPTRGEVFPLAGIEALATGLPVVATRVGALPELVRDGQTGRLLDIDDGKALGDALEELVTDHALRRRMSEQARADAVERFDSRRNALRVFEFIRSCA